MAVQDDLMAIERQLWTGGADSYHANLDASCLIVFPKMAGVMTREQIAGSVEGAPRNVCTSSALPRTRFRPH